MRDESPAQREALTAVMQEMLAMADEIEAQAETWAAALEKLGEEHAARLRRKAYELQMRQQPKSLMSMETVNSHGEAPAHNELAQVA